jgi:hypothetical protein
MLVFDGEYITHPYHNPMQQTTTGNRLDFHQWLGAAKNLGTIPKIPNNLMILNGEVVQIADSDWPVIGLPDGTEVNIINHDDLKSLVQVVSMLKAWIEMCPIQSASRGGIEDFS